MDIFGIIFSPSDIWLLGIAGILTGYIIRSVVRRASIRFVSKRKAHTENISKCMAPFKDAIANIHFGKHNYIYIMRNFFRTQEEAIAIFKSQCEGKDFTGLQKAWEDYENNYKYKAKHAIHTQFAIISEPIRSEELNLLHKFLTNIINEIKNT